MKLKSNVILVGFMGAGKTTTGKELAKLLGYEFLDMDYLIEQRNGKEIRRIFEEDGEEFFRNQEREVINSLLTKEKIVLSTGGGSWLSDENREKLLKIGSCVWLKVSPRNAFERLGTNLSQRPLLISSEDPFKKMEELLVQRNLFYSRANLSVETDKKKPREVAAEIIKLLKEDDSFDLRSMQK